MIPFDFEYYKPKTIQESVDLFQTLTEEGKHPVFFSGGTEIITLGRINHLYTEAVIDIRDIPACKVMEFDEHYLYLGAGRSLTEIEDANYFPLLTATSKEIADHTARNKITLGGNICANIFYREAVLPLLISDSQVFIGGPEGIKAEPIMRIFDKKLQLKEGEFLIQICTERKYLGVPYVTVKKRKQGDTGYPLITVAVLKIDENINVAISGLCPFPFRSEQMETYLNNSNYSIKERIDLAVKHIPDPILSDTEGSSEYRLFVLKNTLLDCLTELERGNM
ncbi:CO/xanthine dehydrogenase FAD-binding subunit [Evansella vedderi]|uniref:CO/xanthine dehydrogenase FAD-binding subunit n=1 Tax=Evansella vedderi TaxID=38282 RepID=A0ABT9ZVV1_9BACI|nr:FAD binding domain-containing protein [Evansella vedderi]MDQ0255080.1 CO/xanthine dehydrogenase FAD-binding subunit [Evansella vedderi]